MVVQLVRMPACHAGGRGFESRPFRKSLRFYLGLFVFMEYFVYILKSNLDQSFYVGYFSDPTKRLEKHNSSHKGFTGKKQPWEIVYMERFPTKSDAKKRENFIKGQKSIHFIKS